jgi:hypothetical protein
VFSGGYRGAVQVRSRCPGPSLRAIPGRFGGGFSKGNRGLDSPFSPFSRPLCYNPAMSKALPFDRDAARQDIERRNQLRPESHLPVLDIDSELKRLAQVHNESEFEQFIDSSALYHRAMRRGRYRYTKRNHGTFHFITDGMELQNCIRRGMAKRREEITRCTARALVIQPPPP